ncbi:MAG TPA: host attachment protein [Chthoniobacterales bacterium]|jgi:hypothetical protein
MNTGKYLFIADRGTLKIFITDSNHPSTLRAVETFRIEEAHGRFQDEYADQAGAFPNGGSAGQGNSIAERQSVSLENEARSLRNIAGKISNVLEQNHGARWSLAAPAQIHNALLEEIPAAHHGTMASSLKKDLVNVPTDQILSHWDS